MDLTELEKRITRIEDIEATGVPSLCSFSSCQSLSRRR